MNIKIGKVLAFWTAFFATVPTIVLLNCSTKVDDDVSELKINDDLKDTLRTILEEGQLTSERTGYELETSQQYHRVNWIIENASSSDLEILVHSQNGIFKAIGFKGLYKRQESNWYENLLHILPDTSAHLYYLEGSLGKTMKVSEFCLNKVIHYKLHDPTGRVINNAQRKEINHLISKYDLDIGILED